MLLPRLSALALGDSRDATCLIYPAIEKTCAGARPKDAMDAPDMQPYCNTPVTRPSL